MERTGHVEGFSLIEVLLLVGIAGVILWVVIPIGLRTRVDAQFGIVRQNCSELAAYTTQWAQKAIQAQDEQRSSATLADYYGSLAGLPHAPRVGPAPGEWVAGDIGPTNWRLLPQVENPRYTRHIKGRHLNGKRATAPEFTVEELVPPGSPIKNPFTGESVFSSANFPVEKSMEEVWAIPGAIAFGGIRENKGDWATFAFVFQGNRNTGIELDGPDTFHSGMSLQTLQGLGAGVFVARIR